MSFPIGDLDIRSRLHGNCRTGRSGGNRMNHQHIVHKLNRRADIARENQCMEELELHARPLFWAVFIAAAAVVLWIATEDYRDVAQHRYDTMTVHVENDRISALLALCANQQVVPFDGGLLQCSRLKLMKGLK